ncbi:IucC family-domain-containing protein [Dichotomocladium elegans]|nr:IucC family-domain-containing protein [Dichotomocladium elegans]
MPAPYSTVKNLHYGRFSSTSRLIACLVIEGLVRAYWIPCKDRNNNGLIGLCVLMRPSERGGLLAAVPLRGLPEMSSDESLSLGNKRYLKVTLADPWDMLPFVFGYRERQQSTAPIPGAEEIQNQVIDILRQTGFKVANLVGDFDAVELWRTFAYDFGVSESLLDLIGSELVSSMENQTYAYDHPKPLPTLTSSPLDWEQAILEGHATHPMNKARRSIPPLPPLHPGQYDFDHPQLRLIAIPRHQVQLRGNFEQLVKPLVNAMIAKTSDKRDQGHMVSMDEDSHVLMPVHAFQVPNIQERFKDVLVLPEVHSVTAHSLASLRSVVMPTGGLLDGLSLKLCMGIKVTSAMRTMTPFTTYFGPGFSANIVPRLSYDRKILNIERELASAVYLHHDPDVAKHCSCLVREAIEFQHERNDDDAIIVCAALMEKVQQPDTRRTLVEHVWKLDTEAKRAAFLDRYVELALKSFIPPCMENAVAFEAHGQNTLARFDRRTGELKGFVVRDFGGMKIHNDTLKRTCGVELDVLPGSCVVAQSVDECYKLLYHTLFYCHLQRMIRILDMHHNGRGWQMVRTHFKKLVPKDHAMYHYFMEKKKMPGKCLVRMKIQELYRDYIYEPIPNVILCRPHLPSSES